MDSPYLERLRQERCAGLTILVLMVLGEAKVARIVWVALCVFVVALGAVFERGILHDSYLANCGPE